MAGSGIAHEIVYGAAEPTAAVQNDVHRRTPADIRPIGADRNLAAADSNPMVTDVGHVGAGQSKPPEVVVEAPAQRSTPVHDLAHCGDRTSRRRQCGVIRPAQAAWFL